jgi:hypothetical protein
VSQKGRRLGRWLAREEARTLLQAPNPHSIRGMRDRALLGVLVTCALRRGELSRMNCEHLTMRDGRWVFLDFLGKGNKTRSVAVPLWVKQEIDGWLDVAGIEKGPIFRLRQGRVRRGARADRGYRSRVVTAVNTALIDLYWRIGQYISRKIAEEGWGQGTVSALAEYIRARRPNARGFSASNLWRMMQFYETYRGLPKLAPVVRVLSWTHNLLIMSRRPPSRGRPRSAGPPPRTSLLPFSLTEEQADWIWRARV